MQETWRWFGPNDPVTLKHITQAGASGIVTALTQFETGTVWPVAAIEQRKKEIESHGLSWSVVESVAVHNNIKLRKDNYQTLIDNYKQTLENLAAVGVTTVCYNFMPVVDWTRTNLNYSLPNEAKALRFEMTDFVVYDVYILQRKGAQHDYAPDVLTKAKSRYDTLQAAERDQLEVNIIAGLPGGEGSHDREGIRAAIEEFSLLGTEGYRENLFAFLRDVIPTAERVGVKLCIHPDDPPFSLFGLPRVVSTESDARALLVSVPSICNGLTLCAGSYGARGDNDLIRMVKEFGASIFFVHLRNVKREDDGSFYESDHLDGDNDMVGIINALLDEESRRKGEKGSESSLTSIPMRPDHGHLLADEAERGGVNPGYSYGGRLKALAELRGVVYALQSIRS